MKFTPMSEDNWCKITNLARECLESAHYDEAEQLYLHADRIGPGLDLAETALSRRMTVYSGLSAVYEKQQRSADADAMIRKNLSSYPRLRELSYEMCAMTAPRVSNSLSRFGQAPVEAPVEDPMPWGPLLMDSAKVDPCRQSALAALAATPPDQEQARICYERMLANYREALGDEYVPSTLVMELGDLYTQLNANDLAKDTWRLALLYVADDFATRQSMQKFSDACLRDNQLTDAEQCLLKLLQQSIDESGNTVGALCTLASVFERQGRLQSARACHFKSFELSRWWHRFDDPIRDELLAFLTRHHMSADIALMHNTNSAPHAGHTVDADIIAELIALFQSEPANPK